jgi:hypothetical protein
MTGMRCFSDSARQLQEVVALRQHPAFVGAAIRLAQGEVEVRAKDSYWILFPHRGQIWPLIA